MTKPLKERQRIQIQIARKELHLSDDEYRSILNAQTGKTSSTKLDIGQQSKVLEYFKKVLNWKPKKGKKRLSPKGGMGDQRDKIIAIWISMYKEGFIRDGSENALDAWISKMTKNHEKGRIDSIKWLRDVEQAQFVLEALKKWQARERRAAKKAAEAE